MEATEATVVVDLVACWVAAAAVVGWEEAVDVEEAETAEG